MEMCPRDGAGEGPTIRDVGRSLLLYALGAILGTQGFGQELRLARGGTSTLCLSRRQPAILLGGAKVS